MKNFAIIGVGGYIAPRHLKAIKEVGGNLLCALDPNDSVGILDSFFPECQFFTEFERFDRHIDKLRRKGTQIDYISICSPNYLHDSHIRFALRSGANAICEKPLVLNSRNLPGLIELEKETGKRVYTILQTRLHPDIIELKNKIDQIENYTVDSHCYKIDLTYITSRGSWYKTSWKDDIYKSGGIATNIGIHFFDILIWIFGNVLNEYSGRVYDGKPYKNKMNGYLDLTNAKIRWKLSIQEEDLPESIREKGQRTFRSLKVNGQEIEFSTGFTELHTASYKEILAGKGFGIEDARPSIELVEKIR